MTKKPTLDKNLLKYYELSIKEAEKNLPEHTVSIADGVEITPELLKQREILEGHIRYVQNKSREIFLAEGEKKAKEFIDNLYKTKAKE